MKAEITSVGSGICSGMSILGSYQICHSVCTVVIALLTVVGITVNGMPLLFLTKVAVPFWIGAVVLLLVGFIMAFGFKLHLSKKLLLANTGLIITGIPFLQQYAKIFWTMGGFVIVTSIIWAIWSRR